MNEWFGCGSGSVCAAFDEVGECLCSSLCNSAWFTAFLVLIEQGVFFVAELLVEFAAGDGVQVAPSPGGSLPYRLFSFRCAPSENALVGRS